MDRCTVLPQNIVVHNRKVNTVFWYIDTTLFATSYTNYLRADQMHVVCSLIFFNLFSYITCISKPSF